MVAAARRYVPEKGDVVWRATFVGTVGQDVLDEVLDRVTLIL